MGASILLVEDHDSTRRTLLLYLQQEGYEVDVEANGLDAYGKIKSNHYDLILLDLMLPKMDGKSLCKRIRQESDVPIIMLTALASEMDLLKGFDLGADDYVYKPFSPRELMARIRARLKSSSVSDPVLQAGDLSLHCESKEVMLAGNAVKLTKSEFQILEILMRTPGRVYTRDELIERAFGHDYEGTTKNIDIHISNLRKRLGADTQHGDYIETVVGHGYRLKQAAATEASVAKEELQ